MSVMLEENRQGKVVQDETEVLEGAKSCRIVLARARSCFNFN